MEDKQQGNAKAKKAPKDPQADYKGSLYEMPGKPGAYGFPSVAFKKCMVAAARHVDGLKMTELRGAFHVLGEFVEINGTPRMRTDTVRLQTGVADIRYRGEFVEWSATLTIRYLQTSISPSQLFHLLNVGGFSCGVGENRPEKSGAGYGQFEVDPSSAAEIA